MEKIKEVELEIIVHSNEDKEMRGRPLSDPLGSVFDTNSRLDQGEVL